MSPASRKSSSPSTAVTARSRATTSAQPPARPDMFALSWRLQRVGLIGMTGVGVFSGLVQAAVYTSAAGSTAASRLAFGQQMETAGRQFSLFLPLPHGVETIAG